ncbi:hypothetical protein ACIBBD_02180 [Streptomyces sp. NPDC051315]|uniref:hypothetical protein n=1 Tax=Streptomyces sp. NPDC051315 TaxID=3365650 RepID=UPI0037B705C7
MSAADELRAAATGLRAANSHLTLKLADPLADWLDFEADLIDRMPGAELRGRTRHALAVARQILGTTP